MSENIDSALKAPLEEGKFPVTFELVPGRGSKQKWVEDMTRFIEAAAADKRLAALSFTDRPGGGRSMSSDVLCTFAKSKGIGVLSHVAAKDYSRNEFEGHMYSLDFENMRDVLLLTGDYPTEGYQGMSQPVFDIDSVWMTKLVTEMNKGLPSNKSVKTGDWLYLKPTQFFKAVACSPFKGTAEELAGQYWKLIKKLEAGADFIIPQLGYDMRKFDELMKFVRRCGSNVPILGNVYVLPYGVAKRMHQGLVPGAVVSDGLLEQLKKESEAPDKGKAAYLTRAAKMMAVLKGLGYHGIHLGGHGLAYADVIKILDEFPAYEKDWKNHLKDVHFPVSGWIYLFEEDPNTCMNTETWTPPRSGDAFNLEYAYMSLIHTLLFHDSSPLYYLAKKISQVTHANPTLDKAVDFFERVMKSAANHCQECGDCALPEIAFLCPESQCPKGQRNGPCGGSLNKWCEVYPDKQYCIWVRAYQRAGLGFDDPNQWKDFVAPRNHNLVRTPSWTNFYLGLDHTKDYGIPSDQKIPDVAPLDLKMKAKVVAK